LGIVEIIVILAVALIVIPPENLPDVMRATGKILRELRLASNMVVRELGGALDQPTDTYTPPINTMKPSAIANGAKIAQSAAPTDPAVPSAIDLAATPAAPIDVKTSADLAIAAAAPMSASSEPIDSSSEPHTESATASAASESVPAGSAAVTSAPDASPAGHEAPPAGSKAIV